MARGPANRVVAYLQRIDPTLSTIDHLILSHPHQDHVELLPDVFATYTVRDVWDSGAVNNICGYRAFVQAVHDESGVRYHNALQDGGTRAVHFEQKTGGCYGNPAPATTITLSLSSRISDSPITLGQGATMTVLHADGGAHTSFNENTVVIRLDLGTTRVLLMGDAEAGNRASPSVPPAASSIEGVLLDCCVSDVASHVMIVGHHGSKTSSRRAFLNAVGPLVFVVSSGPKKYSTVVLPDAEVISELSGRGQVFRTDVNDAACATNGTKIGPTADGEAGGCDAVRISIPASGAPQVAIFHGSSD
jgi:beta-lactamase superfamily II metal-dependent hydrolase